MAHAAEKRTFGRAILGGVNQTSVEQVPASAADEMALCLRLSERCAAAGEHREALRHYQRYHLLYAQQMEQRLSAQSAGVDPALLDPDTGLASQQALRKQLPLMLQRAQAGAAGLCMARIELDALQPAKGLPAEIRTAVLRELGALLRANSRSKDLAAADPGGLLTLVISDVELAMARSICERLRRAVQNHDWARLHAPLRVSLSIGLTALRHGDDERVLCTRADGGLASARRDGGNCVRSGA